MALARPCYFVREVAQFENRKKYSLGLLAGRSFAHQGPVARVDDAVAGCSAILHAGQRACFPHQPPVTSHAMCVCE